LDSPPYIHPYLAAKQELEQRLKECEVMQQRISWLQASIAALEPLANVNPIPPPQYGSLTDLCYAVLSANPGRPMTIPEIRHVIELMGIQLEYSNTAAVINTTLRRLAGKADCPIELAAPELQLGGLAGPPRFFWNPMVPAPVNVTDANSAFAAMIASPGPEAPNTLTGANLFTTNPLQGKKIK
jgi:hypothetical protein